LPIQQAKNIIGLSCGRKNGNSEILLKEALMGAEELGFGISSEIIRVMDLRVKPCTGCQGCGGPGLKSKDNKCVIKDDDVEWILEKTMLEETALIISFPSYHLQMNGYLKLINDRMNHIFARDINVMRKTKVGALICVGGSGADWTGLALPTANIFLQHTRKLVDQMQVSYCPNKGDILGREDALSRARELGRNVAKSIMLPIDKVEYLGSQSDISCPVCHSNLLQVPDNLPRIFCPICWIQGEVFMDGGLIRIKWNEEDIKSPRFSIEALQKHFKANGEVREKFLRENKDRLDRKSELINKYVSYGKVISPKQK
jgi:multimeric flavodoxin WrbA